jgi:predicted DNA-binding transcriptional regulator AlpA
VSAISYTTIWRKMRAGTFPRSRQIDGKAAWFEDEIDAWIDSQPLVQLKPDD